MSSTSRGLENAGGSIGRDLGADRKSDLADNLLCIYFYMKMPVLCRFLMVIHFDRIKTLPLMLVQI